MKFVASILLFGTLLAGPVRADAEEKPESKKAEESAPAQPEGKDAEEEKSAADEFDIPVPIGQPVKGLKVPHYDEEGNLQFLFEADVTRKVDETHIEMDTLKIDAYGDDGKKIYIEMPVAVFNLETRILNGDENVLIRREDFEIVGDAGEFHIKSRYAKIIGRVKMTIFSTENFEQP